MKDVLIELVRLDRIDTQLNQLSAQKNKYPLEVELLGKKKDALSDELNEFLGRYKAVQVQSSSLEKEVEGNNEKIKKFEGQLFEVKDNDSYKALQNEIKAMKDKNSKIEDEILVKMDEVDQSEQNIAEKKKELKIKEDDLVKKENVCKTEVARLTGEIKEWKEKRDAGSKNIDRAALKQYEKVLNHTKDFAIVSIIKDECGGCHIRLSPQVVNEAMALENIVTCPTCSRMLYSKRVIPEDA